MLDMFLPKINKTPGIALTVKRKKGTHYTLQSQPVDGTTILGVNLSIGPYRLVDTLHPLLSIRHCDNGFQSMLSNEKWTMLHGRVPETSRSSRNTAPAFPVGPG